MNVVTVLWLAFLFLALVSGLYYVWTLFFGVPFVPSSKQIITDTLRILKDPGFGVKKDWPAVELGAGDGRMAFALANNGFRVTAVEIVPFFTLWMRSLKFFSGQKLLDIKNINMYKYDYHNFRIALIYLFPNHMQRLEDKLFREMPKGSLLLSNTFSFRKHQPVKKIGKLLVYQVN